MTANQPYHYTECGLDSVYLLNGFDFVETSAGRGVIIQDIDGLHRTIGLIIVEVRKALSGPEIRFLRTEMLLSQSTLAQTLGVTGQTVARWEKGTNAPSLPSDAILRLMYCDHVGEGVKITQMLERIADIEADVHDPEIKLRGVDDIWQLDKAA